MNKSVYTSDILIDTNLGSRDGILNTIRITNDKTLVESLINSVPVNTIFTTGQSLLTYKINDIEQLKILLEAGADPNIGEGVFKMLNVLTYEIRLYIEMNNEIKEEQFETLELLLQYGLRPKDIEIKNEYDKFMEEYQDQSNEKFKAAGNKFLKLFKKYNFVKNLSEIPTLGILTYSDNSKFNAILYRKDLLDLKSGNKTISDFIDLFDEICQIIITELTSTKKTHIAVFIDKSDSLPVIYLNILEKNRTIDLLVVDIRSDFRGKKIFSVGVIPMMETVALHFKKVLSVTNIINPIVSSILRSLDYQESNIKGVISMIKKVKKVKKVKK